MRRLAVAAGIALAISLLYGLAPPRPRMHHRARQPSTCFANIGRIGKALRLYAQDYDERFPLGTTMHWRGGRSQESISKHTMPPLGAGWAGQVYAYLRDADAFCCPQDPTPAYEPAVTVSFGLNEAEAGATAEPGTYRDRPDASRIVLLFEVSGATAEVRSADEGESRGATAFSAVGDGHFGVRTAPEERGTTACFAIGDVSGMGWGSCAAPPRHHRHANYCMVDGHVKSLPPYEVTGGIKRLPGEPRPHEEEPRYEAYFWPRFAFDAEARGRAKALVCRGDAMMSRHRFAEAKSQYRAAARMYRMEARAYARLAEAYERDGNRTTELAYLRQALDHPGTVFDGSAFALMNMRYAVLLADDNRWAEAAQRYDAAMRIAGITNYNAGATRDLPSSARDLDHVTFGASAELYMGTYGIDEHLMTREGRLRHIKAAMKLKPQWELARRWYASLIAPSNQPSEEAIARHPVRYRRWLLPRDAIR